MWNGMGPHCVRVFTGTFHFQELWRKKAARENICFQSFALTLTRLRLYRSQSVMRNLSVHLRMFHLLFSDFFVSATGVPTRRRVRTQQASSPFTKTGLTLLKECCGFTCSIMQPGSKPSGLCARADAAATNQIAYSSKISISRCSLYSKVKTWKHAVKHCRSKS